jgi:hypothetical protein
MLEDAYAVEGFDERLETAEDSDFSQRLRRSGVEIYCVREAGLVMDWGTPLRELRRFFIYGRGQAQRAVVDTSAAPVSRRLLAQTMATVITIPVLTAWAWFLHPWWGVGMLAIDFGVALALASVRRLTTWRPVRQRLQALSYCAHRYRRSTRSLRYEPRNRTDWTRYGA